MANRPTYSPTDFRIAAQDHRRNRALTDPFEPGSIFKWAVVAGAIDKRIVRETDVFNCRGGTWVHNGRTIRDVHGYGDLTVRKIVVKSSNIGMAQIGLKMGQQRLHECLTAFGFGRKTGIELATVENTGLLYPLSRWTSYSTPSISFGQEITVTPIQMVTAFSALCNGGYLYRPKLVKALVDRSAGVGGAARVVEDYSQPVGQRILSEATARTMVDILTEAVEEGTGQKAKSSRRIRIFGKTGTAQIAERGVYVHGKWTASFICGGQFLDQPDRSPSVVVLVSIRKPDPKVGYYGGTVAAPAARQIVEKALAFLQPLN